MAAKPMILRELEKLPPDALKEVEKFVGQLKRAKKKQTRAQNGKVLAKKQTAAIRNGRAEIWGQDLPPEITIVFSTGTTGDLR